MHKFYRLTALGTLIQQNTREVSSPEGMKRICGFLELLKNSAKDKVLFDKQFFTPFQLAAKMLDDLRNLTNTPRSTDLEGWSFQYPNLQ